MGPGSGYKGSLLAMREVCQEALGISPMTQMQEKAYQEDDSFSCLLPFYLGYSCVKTHA